MKRFSMQLLFALLCMVLLLPGSQARAGVQSPTDPGQILTEAYALEDGMSLEYVATLTGVITQIKTPYDSHYRNITVTIQVPGYEQMPIVCYRMNGENADAIGVEDTITVTGTLTNYRGTIEFRQGCTLDSWVDYVVDWYVPTDADIVDAAYKLEPGTSLPYIASLTGRIVSVDTLWDDMFENITVTMVVEGRETKPIQCYRLRGEGAQSLKAGDIITVMGTLANYNGTIEFQQGCQLLGVESGGPVETLILSGTATFETWEDACWGFGAVFTPGDDGTMTVEIIACDPGYYLTIFADGERVDEYFGTDPEKITVPVYQGVTYFLDLYTITANSSDFSLWDYALGSVSLHVTADVPFGGGSPDEPTPEEPTPEEPTPNEPTPEEPTEFPDSMAIVGDPLPGINAWNPADPEGDMTQVYEGVYNIKLTFDSPCQAKFKFIGNDFWDDEWNFGKHLTVEFNTLMELERGPGSADITVNIDKPCTLDIYLDLTNGADNPMLFVGVEYPLLWTRNLYAQVPDSWSQVYAYAWDVNGASVLGDWPGTLLQKDDQWYIGQIPVEDANLILTDGVEMKMTDDLYLEDGADVWITVSNQLNYNGKYLTTIRYADVPQPVEPIYRVTGNADWMGNWNPAFEQGQMEKVAPGVYTKIFENVPAGTYEFRITKDGRWDDNFGCQYGNNYVVTLPRASDLIITLTYWDDSWEISVTYDGLASGDINCDGKRNIADVSKLYAHVRGSIVLEELEVLQLADLNGDGKVNVADVSMLYAQVRGVSPTPIGPSSSTEQAKIVDQAYRLPEGTEMNYDVTLRGRIVQVNDAYDPNYRNITVTIAVKDREAMPIRCYRLKGEYVDRLAVGDTIEVTGRLQNYYGVIEFDNGCLLTAWNYAG